MASQGPLFPGTTANLSNAGTSENAEAWVNPGNIVSDNATEAAITAATYDSPDISQILVASNFSFTIPLGATIDGITVEIDRRSIIASSGKDFRVQLAKGTTFASLVGDNKAVPATIWPTTTAVATYGSSSDLWNTTWTQSEVNASSFAVFLSCQANIANADVGVDFIRVTVNYTPDTTPDRTTTEAAVASESTVRLVAAGRGTTEAPSSSESSVRLLSAVRSDTEAVTTSDSASGSVSSSNSRLRVYDIEFQIPGSTAEPQNYNRGATDTVATSESVARTASLSRSTTDAPVIAVTANRAVAYSRTASDSVTTTETPARFRGIARSTTDAPTTSDTATRSGAFTRTATDTTSVTTTVGRSLSTTRTVSDTVSTTDSVLGTVSSITSITDTTSVTDSIAVTRTALRFPTDTVSVTDSIATQGVFTRTATDTVPTTDEVEGRRRLQITEQISSTLSADTIYATLFVDHSSSELTVVDGPDPVASTIEPADDPVGSGISAELVSSTITV